ncbi:MAG: PDC sensor domain-containing protein, partial [Nitrospirota bacterium]
GISEDFSNRDWFLQPIKTGKTYITDFYKSVMTGALCITVSAPVRNIEEEIVGIFGMDIKFEELLKMVNDTDFEEEVIQK